MVKMAKLQQTSKLPNNGHLGGLDGQFTNRIPHQNHISQRAM